MTLQDTFLILSSSEKKQLVELMLEEVLIQIKDEKRSLKKWESHQLKSALACLGSGLYSAARQAVILSGANKSEVSEPEKWFALDEETELRHLKDKLENIKASPPRNI